MGPGWVRSQSSVWDALNLQHLLVIWARCQVMMYLQSCQLGRDGVPLLIHCQHSSQRLARSRHHSWLRTTEASLKRQVDNRPSLNHQRAALPKKSLPRPALGPTSPQPRASKSCFPGSQESVRGALETLSLSPHPLSVSLSLCLSPSLNPSFRPAWVAGWAVAGKGLLGFQVVSGR